MEKKRAWIYCRVAHSGLETGELLDTQEIQLKSYSKKHGYEIVGSSRDIGSGLTLIRPGLLDFLDAVDNEAVDLLLLSNLDRLGRNIALVFQFWQLLSGRGFKSIQLLTAKLT